MLQISGHLTGHDTESIYGRGGCGGSYKIGFYEYDVGLDINAKLFIVVKLC